MFPRLRENHLYMLLALAFAIALHVYVTAQSHGAVKVQTLTVPLTVQRLPSDLVLEDKDVPSIILTVSGTGDDIAHLGLRAWVDLSHARAGKYGPIPVHVSPLSGPLGGDVTPVPAAVSLFLQPKVSRLLPITVSAPQTPPVGYAFGDPDVTPRRASVIGTRANVEAVVRLVVKANAGSRVGAVHDDFTIVGLDAEGSQITDVGLVPASAHVLVPLVRVPASKTLVISPMIVGTLSARAQFQSIAVSPATVVASGRPERLAQIGTINTQPIDISGAASTLVRRVSCHAPLGIRLFPAGPVTVTIRFTAPSPPPTPKSPETKTAAP